MRIPSLLPQNARLIAAFFAGQAVMFGLVALLRPTPAGAQAEPEAVTAPAIVVRKTADGAGIQLAAGGSGGGPSLSFFDAHGVSRMQLTLDGKGSPAVVLRGKSGTVQMGIGLQDDHPVVAVRGADGTMTPVPLPAPGSAPSATSATSPK